MRVGFGYDIHRLGKARRLFLCGVEIPYTRGLVGHSDADVALHAVADAIIGALGLGDIGEHFPNTDKTYKDIASGKLLKKVGTLLKRCGMKIQNIDITIIAEEPRIQPFKERMRETIARILDVTADRINIKATTQEGVGSIGRKEAIASSAVVLLKKR